ncbi:hypothetical protein JCM9279_000900 [Rhodotorula babjevae]
MQFFEPAPSFMEEFAKMQAEIDELTLLWARDPDAAERRAAALLAARTDPPGVEADEELEGDSSTSYYTCESGSSPDRLFSRPSRPPTPIPSLKSSTPSGDVKPEILVFSSSDDNVDEEDSPARPVPTNDSPADVKHMALVVPDSHDDNGGAPGPITPLKDARTPAPPDTIAMHPHAARKALKEANVGGKVESAA